MLWDPAATRTLSVKTQKSLGDFNVFEGRTVTGAPTTTISQGKVVYVDGDLRAERGAGRYVQRPAFSSQFDAMARWGKQHAPLAVQR